MAKNKGQVATEQSEKAPKKRCPLTKEEFVKSAKPLAVTVNGVPMAAAVKEFSTGSFGWYLNGKTAVEINGTTVDVSLGFNLTCVGSKPDNGD